MANKNLSLILAAVVVIAIIALVNGTMFQSILGTETMTRTGPTIVDPNQQFTITYAVQGATDTWGASIEDSVTGGCKFPSGDTAYKSVMLSEDGNTKSIVITAPSSGSCTFVGDYKFGSFAITSFNPYTVQVCSPICDWDNLDACESQTTDGCGGICERDILKNTFADEDCNNIVDRDEMGNIITKWTQGTVSRTQLGEVIQAWAK